MAPLILAPTVITVDRERFTLDLYKLKGGRRYRRVKRYKVAVGALGMATPYGLYFAEAKSRTPDWLHEGVLYPFEDPRNPFEGGFISLAESDGVGIHGVKFDPRLGTRASHGCIRMATSDLLDLWDRVPLGTPVFVH